MNENETALLERCRAGDKDAFGFVVKKYAGRASGAACVLLGCPHEALDASQEAFVRAWRNIRRFNTSSPFYPWYSAILRNVCRSRLRRRARRRTVALTDGHGDSSSDSDPVLLAERNERRDALWRGVMKLSDPFREIILMKHFHEMSYKGIAAALGIPIGTVMSRLHSARRALRETLAGEVS